MEDKETRFCRVAEARVLKIIHMVRLLGNCSKTNIYTYTEEQVAHVFDTLQTELDEARARFTFRNRAGKKRFSLREDINNDPKEHPVIKLLLPDGTYLKAQVCDEVGFPGIEIGVSQSAEEDMELICYAEYNKNWKPAQLCVCTYQAGVENPVSYRTFKLEDPHDE